MDWGSWESRGWEERGITQRNCGLLPYRRHRRRTVAWLLLRWPWKYITGFFPYFQFDEAFEFDAIFQGEFPDEFVNETVDAEARCLPGFDSPLPQVEEAFFVDFRDPCLVLDMVARTVNGYFGIGVTAAGSID